MVCHAVLRIGDKADDVIPVDPALPFAFLEALIAVLEDYFGKLSEAVIKDSFDVVLQVSLSLNPALCLY